MKIKTNTITTKEYLVELEADDWLLVKIGNGKAFALKVDYLTRSICIQPTEEGSIMSEEALRVSFEDLEDIIVPASADYMSIQFPMKLYGKVKERLKDLPVFLPVQK